jgi:hypothetical protein
VGRYEISADSEAVSGEQLPVVPLPSEREMRRRKVIQSHKRAMKLRVQLINLVHGLFVQQGDNDDE